MATCLSGTITGQLGAVGDVGSRPDPPHHLRDTTMSNTNKARNQFDEAVEKARHQFDEAVEKDELKEYLAQHPDFKATCGNCFRKSTMNLQVLCDHTCTDDTAACDDWIPGPMTKEEISALLGFEYDGDIPRLDHVEEIKDEK